MKNARTQVDWGKFVIHFCCGAVLGSAFGFNLWARSEWATSSSAWPGGIIVTGASILVGLIAGFQQDAFWTNWDEEYQDFILIGLKALALATCVGIAIWLIVTK